ncbi:hypothetical protein [uncultured Methanobrevibacter sp.]|uniref:hypothetical protein n=1 Tax=uncultured Methanobrevibacter sp. TaxID=253161 RepID=UPI0025E95139|nr:hypothetical protein [uncultured Methanobrevibacter sp.]
MNSANQTLQAIKNKKALLTKEKNEAISYIEECYKKDMEVLNKEEKEWLEQFDDISIDDIYHEESKVKKYRKKPIIVEAYVATKEEHIKTLEGTMKADKGDYVITGIRGERYPCKPDIFKQTYEEVKQ